MSRRNRRACLAGLVVLCVLPTGCGDESLIGPDEFYRVAGPYTGAVEGVVSDGSFSGAMWISLSQSEGTLAGTYDFSGDFHHAAYDRRYYQDGSGTVEGSLTSGPDARVTLTLTPDDCPDRVMSYQGGYDDGRRQISIAGALALSTELCDPLLSIPHSTILVRD